MAFLNSPGLLSTDDSREVLGRSVTMPPTSLIGNFAHGVVY